MSLGINMDINYAWSCVKIIPDSIVSLDWTNHSVAMRCDLLRHIDMISCINYKCTPLSLLNHSSITPRFINIGVVHPPQILTWPRLTRLSCSQELWKDEEQNLPGQSKTETCSRTAYRLWQKRFRFLGIAGGDYNYCVKLLLLLNQHWWKIFLTSKTQVETCVEPFLQNLSKLFLSPPAPN